MLPVVTDDENERIEKTIKYKSVRHVVAQFLLIIIRSVDS